MNLLLKAALFIREAGTDLNLSSTERLVIFTLAARIGNNPDCWVSQSNLAQECNLSKRHLIRTLNQLITKNIIKSLQDGRRTRYAFVDEKVTSCHQSQSSSDPQNQSQQVTPCHQLDEIGDIMSQVLVTPCHFRIDQKIATAPVNTGLSSIEFSPKYTIENNNQKKVNNREGEKRPPPTKKKSSKKLKTSLTDDYYPNDKHYQYAKEHGIDIESERQAFVNYYIGNGKKWKDWHRAFQNWLIKSKQFSDERREKQNGYQKISRTTPGDLIGLALSGFKRPEPESYTPDFLALPDDLRFEVEEDFRYDG